MISFLCTNHSFLICHTGISVDTLSAEFESRHRVVEDKKIDAAIYNEDDCVDSFVKPMTPEDNGTVTENFSEDVSIQGVPLSVPSQDGSVVDDDSGDIELGDMFLEDSSSGLVLHPEIVELQKKEKMKELTSEKNLEKLEGIWKKVRFAFISAFCVDNSIHMILMPHEISFGGLCSPPLPFQSGLSAPSSHLKMCRNLGTSSYYFQFVNVSYNS